MTTTAFALMARPLPPQFHPLPGGLDALTNLADDSADLIYCDDLAERLDPAAWAEHLRQFARVLKDAGVLRLAVTDLDAVVSAYLFGWRGEAGLGRSERLNGYFKARAGSLFNEEDLTAALREAGFSTVWRYLPRSSNEPLLRGLEDEGEPYRLVLEARKQRVDPA